MRKVAFITGATRGVGKACGLKLAREGYDIVVAARSVKPHDKLPGTIETAAQEMRAAGATALAVYCNLVEQDSIDRAVAATLEKFGRIDVVINNAGALWWRNIEDTPMKRFDLVINVNVRGAFAVTSAFLPAMRKQGSGHIIFMSPPIDLTLLHGHVAYYIGKYGMSMTAIGLAEELAGTGIYATALWPKTIIESAATINFKMGDPSVWRKADILADSVFEILQHPAEANGKCLIDEPFLRSIGYANFDQYKCTPNGTPVELTTDIMRMTRT